MHKMFKIRWLGQLHPDIRIVRCVAFDGLLSFAVKLTFFRARVQS